MNLLEPPTWFNRALALVYPNVCQICGDHPATPREGYVCQACRSGVRSVRTPFCRRCGLPFEGDLTTAFECSNCRELDLQFDAARSAVLACGLVREVIHRYKYRRARWFEPFLAGLLLRQAAPALRTRDWDVILPVPLHPLREREREFNQAAVLARALGRATGIPVQQQWLQRTRSTDTQTRLSRHGRIRNMRRAFSLRRGVRPTGARCVLVDDVLTTGATTSACAHALKAAGARTVCVWTLARGV